MERNVKMCVERWCKLANEKTAIVQSLNQLLAWTTQFQEGRTGGCRTVQRILAYGLKNASIWQGLADLTRRSPLWPHGRAEPSHRNPTTVIMAHVEVQTNEEAQECVQDLDLFVTVPLLDDTPAVS